MTNFFTSIANLLFPFKPLLLLINLISVFLMGYLLLFAPLDLQEQYLQTNLLVLLWSLLLRVLTNSFSYRLQNDKTPNDASSFLLKWKNKWLDKIKSFMLFIYSVAFLILVLATLYFSFRLINIS